MEFTLGNESQTLRPSLKRAKMKKAVIRPLLDRRRPMLYGPCSIQWRTIPYTVESHALYNGEPCSTTTAPTPNNPNRIESNRTERFFFSYRLNLVPVRCVAGKLYMRSWGGMSTSLAPNRKPSAKPSLYDERPGASPVERTTSAQRTPRLCRLLLYLDHMRTHPASPVDSQSTWTVV